MRDLSLITIPDDKLICDLFMDQVGLATVTVADEVGLFKLLGASTMSADQVAKELKTDRRTSETLLHTLCAMGFVKADTNNFSLNEVGSSYLDRRSSVCRIFQLLSYRDSWAHKRLMNLLTNGPDPVSQGDASYTAMWESASLTQEAANRFTGMMNTNISAVAVAVARAGIFNKFTSIADVGGGSGIFLAALAQHAPEKSLTLFDLPEVCVSAREIIKSYIDPAKINYFPGSFFESRWPIGIDAYYFSNILHDWPPEKGFKILKNAYESLPAGGAVFITECLLNQDRLGPKHTVIFNLMMHMNHLSQQYTESGLFDLLLSAGFKNPAQVFSFGYYTVVQADK